jgi:hypothetical protein
MRPSRTTRRWVVAVVMALCGYDVGAQAREPNPTTHECFRYTTYCGSTVDAEITIFGCRYESATDFKYWTRYRVRLDVQTDVTATVTSTEFRPEIGLAVVDAELYTAYNHNTSLSSTATVSARLPGRAEFDVDIYAKSADTGRFRLTLTCAACAEPIITQHPLSTSVPYGGRATLSATAVGKEPLRYAWFDPSNPSFAIAAGQQFVTPPVTQPQAYFAEAINECGKARTLTAIIEPGACDRPSIGVPAAVYDVERGAAVNLDVVATGAAPLAIQWYEGSPPDTSRPVPSPGTTRLTLPSVFRPATYWARVSNACGFADSTPIRIDVTGTARRRSVRR